MNNSYSEADIKYSLLFENSPIPVILSKMPEARVVEVNEAFLKLYGFSKSEVLGKTSQELGLNNDEDVQEVRSRLKKDGFLKDFQCYRKNRNGERICVSMNINFVEISGTQHVLTTLVDLTRQKAVEDQLRLSQSLSENQNQNKSDFLASMSHEIRTPLSVIIGFSEMISKSVTSLEQSQKYASRILQSTKHLKTLLDDILDLSKVEAGKMVLEKITIPLEKFLSDEMALLRISAEHKGLYFNFSQKNIPKTFCTDPTRFRQILNNVIGNAIKYTPTGGITVEARAVVNSQADGPLSLELLVQDTGIGMTEEFQKRIFTPFEQGEHPKRKSFEGSGLGLVLAKKLTRALGGDLYLLNSQEDNGSTFVIRFDHQPHVTGPEISSVPEVKFSDDQWQNYAGLKILSVEDNADIRLILGMLLKNYNIHIEFAIDGEEGLRKALVAKYDLIFMDIQLPRMNGVEVVQKLRQSGIEQPIIAVTSHVLKTEHDHYLKSGFNDCLAKPFGLQSLLKTLVKNIKR